SAAPGCLLMGAGVTALTFREVSPRCWPGLVRWAPRMAGFLAVATLVALMGVTGILIHRRDSHADYLAMRNCAREFVRYVPATESIVVDGGTMTDEYGHPVAYNESMIFAWMDRRGFNYGREELSIETLDRIAARGGRYWVVGLSELRREGLKG